MYVKDNKQLNSKTYIYIKIYRTFVRLQKLYMYV